jgi:hypothetical protein
MTIRLLKRLRIKNKAMFPSFDSWSLTELQNHVAFLKTLGVIVAIATPFVILWGNGYWDALNERITTLKDAAKAVEDQNKNEQIKTEAAQKTAALHDAITRRDLEIRGLDTSGLMQHKGIKVALISRPEDEPCRTAKELANIFRFAGWTVVSSTQRDEYFENGICIGDKKRPIATGVGSNGLAACIAQ